MRFLALLAVLMLVPPMPAQPTPPPTSDADLRDAVARQLPVREESTGTQVNVLRNRREESGSWAFGTAVRRAPAEPETYPDGWLWVARAEAQGWRVALEGSPEFGALTRRAPVLSAREQAVLGELSGAVRAQPDPPSPSPSDPTVPPPSGQPSAAPGPRSERSAPPRSPEYPLTERATDYRTGMRLPYAVGQAWRYTGGPHPMSGSTWSSIDLAGGDGKVRAARGGIAYTMCGTGTGWLRIVHDRGFSTDYYHLRNGMYADGKRVSMGKVVGRIGTDVACGGSATGPHVHFSLRRAGDYVPIDRYGIGRWSIRAGSASYRGSALHGSKRVNVGGNLHNYGALGLKQAVVDTNGGGKLNRRAGPGTNHQKVGTVRDGATVRIKCSARGTTHTGRDGYTSDLWNQLRNGTWVSDVYLWTGTGNPVNGWC